MLKTKTSRLNLMIEGENNAETIILLHGGPGVPDYLSEVSKLLNESYRTVRFDQRGTGESECLNGDYSIEQYLYDLNQIIDHLKIKEVHLFGHSWGGLLAQIFASKNKAIVQSLFLCSPSSGTGDIWKEMEKEVMLYNKNKASSKDWLYVGVNSLYGMLGFDYGYRNLFKHLWKYYFQNPEEAPDADVKWLSGIKAKAMNKTRKSIIFFDEKELDNGLEGFTAPVVVVVGSYDIYGKSKEHIKQRLLKSDYITLKNSGHLPWIQNKDNFIKILYGFYGIS